MVQSVTKPSELTWENCKKEDVIREGNESSTTQFVENTVLIQSQLQFCVNILKSYNFSLEPVETMLDTCTITGCHSLFSFFLVEKQIPQ